MRTTNFTTQEEIKVQIGNNYKSLKETVNGLLEKTDFRVVRTSICTCNTSITLAIYTNPDSNEYIRWNTLDLILNEDPFEVKDSQFKTNIGTTGEFSLNDTSKGSRANFYIQVGKVLGDSELLDSIKIAMNSHSAANHQLTEKWKELIKKEA